MMVWNHQMHRDFLPFSTTGNYLRMFIHDAIFAYNWIVTVCTYLDPENSCLGFHIKHFLQEIHDLLHIYIPLHLSTLPRSLAHIIITWIRSAAEAIAVETCIALTRKGALRVLTDSVSMATARLALINIYKTEREKRNESKGCNNMHKILETNYFLVNGNTTCNAKTISGHLLKHPPAHVTLPRASTGISFCNIVWVTCRPALKSCDFTMNVIRFHPGFSPNAFYTTPMSAEAREEKGDVE